MRMAALRKLPRHSDRSQCPPFDLPHSRLQPRNNRIQAYATLQIRKKKRPLSPHLLRTLPTEKKNDSSSRPERGHPFVISTGAKRSGEIPQPQSPQTLTTNITIIRHTPARNTRTLQTEVRDCSTWNNLHSPLSSLFCSTWNNLHAPCSPATPQGTSPGRPRSGRLLLSASQRRSCAPALLQAAHYPQDAAAAAIVFQSGTILHTAPASPLP